MRVRLPAGASRATPAAALLAAFLLVPGLAPAQAPTPGKLRTLPPSAAEIQPRLRSGNWQLGVAIEIQPRVAGPSTPPMEITRCLGPRQVDELMQATPGAMCVPDVTRFTPDRIEWRHSCRHNNATAVAEGRLDFRDTRLEGTIVTTSPESGLRITTRIAGRYLGVCVDTTQKPDAARPAAPAPGPTLQPPRPGERLHRYNAP